VSVEDTVGIASHHSPQERVSEERVHQEERVYWRGEYVGGEIVLEERVYDIRECIMYTIEIVWIEE